jgi:hypothetical protein
MSSNDESTDLGVVNGIQLNIVSVIDFVKANYSQSLDGCVYMSDNSFKSINKGTDSLETVCTQGQVLNWLIFPTNLDELVNPYKYCPTVRISNIVFLHENGEVYQEKIFENLHSYGSLEKGRPYLMPPVYYYWAGNVQVDLPVGKYRYRLVLELDSFSSPVIKSYLNLDSASLNVVSLVEPMNR